MLEEEGRQLRPMIAHLGDRVLGVRPVEDEVVPAANPPTRKISHHVKYDLHSQAS